MTATPAHAALDAASYAGVRVACALVNALGPGRAGPALASLGAAVGGATWNRARLGRAMDNIAWCFPDWDEASVARCAQRSYRHLFALGAEMALSPRLVTEGAWPARISAGHGFDQALPILLSGRPSILITGHSGNWELLGAWVAGLGVPLTALYRPLDNPLLDGWVRRTRAARGISLIDKFGAMQSLPGVAAEGGAVGFIADQNAGERGLFVPFFDRLASTYKSIGLLAMRYDMPIICGHARRLRGVHGEPAWRARYQVDVVDLIRPDDWTDQADPLFYVTARYRRAIETMVRAAPEQHLWLHRYWKSRPRHEREGRPFPTSLRRRLESLPWMTTASLRRITARSEADARAKAAS